MGNPDKEHDEGFLGGYKPRSFNRSTQQSTTPNSSKNRKPKASATDKETSKDEFSTAISWPIILAVIPTLGAFIAGSAEVWSDFIMILLILYYVYKWITVPWAYYESARSRRMIHQYATNNNNQTGLDPNKKRDTKRKESVEEELRRHELMGLVWVVISPGVAGYTLQYSRYFLSNYDKYMSTFNVTVFVLAATLKPLIHVMALLRERTVFLQSEMLVNESETDLLRKKLDMMEEELEGLRKAFATKRDLGQVANGITPTIQNITKAIRRLEKQEKILGSWSEERFTEIDQKVQDFDQFICYSIEQDQKKSGQKILFTLMFLPINLTFWAARRMTGLLPIPRALLGFTPNKSPRSTSTYRPNSKHLTHPDIPTSSSSSEPMMQQPENSYHRRHATTANDPSEVSYSGEESVPQHISSGHRPRS